MLSNVEFIHQSLMNLSINIFSFIFVIFVQQLF